MSTTRANLDAVIAMVDSVPTWSDETKRVAREVYRQLIRGAPVPREDLAEALDTQTDEIVKSLAGEQLKGWVFYDDDKRVIGFRGLAIREMPHRFEVDGRTLFTWCALDSLFLPEILGTTARVESRDPHTGTAITLTVTPDGVESRRPAGAVMSIVITDPEVVKTNPAKIMASFCHHIFFLESAESGANWTASHGGGTFLVSLDEAFAIGKRLNEAQFG